jgi:hypothetical protein
MKRLVIIAAFLAVALIGAVPALASSHHVQQQSRRFGGKELVSQASTPLCANADGTTGDKVIGAATPCGGGHNEIFSEVADNICNGDNVVTQNCPFTVGLGLNATFKNWHIYKISNDFYGTLWWETFAPANILQETSGDGVSWVQFSDCSSSGGCSLINIAASNALNSYGHYAAACSEGLNNALKLEDTPTASRCAWNSQ